ncbi:hypothetical protein Ssi02_36590 [Sinosporangium siamense]|uniref:DUF418 domain-containing protein n=2 Tax=Sinosporangium siamense TaxID=1367973 RepID=A0A919RGY8_9ACTN|nr:hypothetical protein Ssi02_36590 [Sinosporangium siamense]
MLLLIALAHAHIYLSVRSAGFRGYSKDGDTVDRFVAGAQVLLVDGRALPLFAALFGYGLAHLAQRQTDAGRDWPQVRKLLRRRSLWLFAFGLCHVLLLFFGDILGAYGLIGLMFVGFIRRSDRALLWAAVVGLVLHVAVLFPLGLVTVTFERTMSPTAMAEPIEALVSRLTVWSMMTPTYLVVSVLPTFFLGIWAARRRLLDHPGLHRALLTRAATLGVGTAVAGGLPLTLIDTQLWSPSDMISVTANTVHSLTGVAGGVGYAALFALLADRTTGHPGPIAKALAACGQWSLTCYLLQSVLFVAIFTPYLGGLGTKVGDAAASGIAVIVWLATVLLAASQAPRGRRGPAESLLRRLTYGKAK